MTPRMVGIIAGTVYEPEVDFVYYDALESLCL